jgi:hypothetical protein
MKDKAADQFAYITMAVLLILALGTVLGIWIKLFWLGWVLR